jgi:hypothetical protein
MEGYLALTIGSLLAAAAAGFKDYTSTGAKRAECVDPIERNSTSYVGVVGNCIKRSAFTVFKAVHDRCIAQEEGTDVRLLSGRNLFP